MWLLEEFGFRRHVQRDQVRMANHYYYIGRDMRTAELCLLCGGVAAVQECRTSINEISPYYFTDREGRICNKGTGYDKSISSLHELKVYRHFYMGVENG